MESLAGGGYAWRQGAHVVREASEAAFLCSLSIEMVLAMCAGRRGLLRLHAAAAVGHGCGLVFCGTHHAGKSVLITRLAAGGWQGFGDDMVALTPEGELFSFGIAPRLRLPLPPSDAVRAFVSRRRGCGDPEALYLDATLSGTAPWGTRHAAHAVVVLRRTRTGAARLRALGAAEGVRALLSRALFESGQGGETLHAACDLLERLPCVELSYSSVDAAAQRLAVWVRQGLPEVSAAVTVPGRAMAVAADEGRVPPEVCWCRMDGIAFRQAGQEGFLSDVRGASLYRLTPLGCAIWHMLAEPLSEAQAVALLAEAFPDAERPQIAADVARLFTALQRRGLIART